MISGRIMKFPGKRGCVMTPPMLQSSHYWSSLTSCANFRTQYCCPKSTRLIYTPVTRCSWWDSFKESAHEDRIESVARFGHISKPRTQARYTVDIEKKKNVTADAHLIEFSAWGGSSGSPVFINDASLHAPREDKFYEPPPQGMGYGIPPPIYLDRKSTRLNSSHLGISYAVFCLKK